eukprot:s2034_g6.t1
MCLADDPASNQFKRSLELRVAARSAFWHEYLHIIYRHLKPENILLTETGQMKLTDMGGARYAPKGRTFATSGTPGFFAPEMLNRCEGHTNAVDWWQLGCLIAELMSGDPPFEYEDFTQLKAKILTGVSAESLPDACKKSEPCSM